MTSHLISVHTIAFYSNKISPMRHQLAKQIYDQAHKEMASIKDTWCMRKYVSLQTKLELMEHGYDKLKSN